MSEKNKSTTLNWEAFQSLGNPNNAPDEPIENTDNSNTIEKSEKIRIILDRKNRRGKSVSLITGLEEYDDKILKPIAKTLKSLCGVGGNVKYGEIMIQGDHRDKIIEYLTAQGYTNVKKSGG